MNEFVCCTKDQQLIHKLHTIMSNTYSDMQVFHLTNPNTKGNEGMLGEITRVNKLRQTR